MKTIRNQFRATNTIKSEGNNGVFHNVYFFEDGRIEADKIIDGRVTCTYNWSTMSRNEIERMAETSGHEAYTMCDEIVDKHERLVEIKEIKSDLTKGLKWHEGTDARIQVSVWEYDENGETEYVVNVSVWDEEDDSIWDKEVDIYSNLAKAKARKNVIAKNLENSFRTFKVVNEAEIIHGV